MVSCTYVIKIFDSSSVLLFCSCHFIICSFALFSESLTVGLIVVVIQAKSGSTLLSAPLVVSLSLSFATTSIFLGPAITSYGYSVVICLFVCPLAVHNYAALIRPSFPVINCSRDFPREQRGHSP